MSFGFGKLADPLNKGERFPEIMKSKRAFDAGASSRSTHSGAWLWKRKGVITCKRRDAAATRRAGFLREGLGHVTVSNVTNKCNGGRSAIDSPNTMSSEPMIAATSAGSY